MLSEDMWENLDRFYAWDRVSNPSNIGYPPVEPTRRLLGSTVGSEPLSDDEAQHMDRALGALKAADGEGYRLVQMVHRDRRTLRWLEVRGHGDRKRNGRVLSAAHNFVKGFLFGAEVA